MLKFTASFFKIYLFIKWIVIVLNLYDQLQPEHKKQAQKIWSHATQAGSRQGNT